MKKEPYYLTTAIAYTSGKPHIGNTYEIVLADAIVRYKRFQGYDVRFQTGTDEHGQKIELKAAESGITPKQFVDEVSAEIQRIWDLMISLSGRPMPTMNVRYRRFLRSSMTRAIYTRDFMRGCTVHPVSLSLPHRSLWTANVRTAGGSVSRRRKTHTF